MTSGDDRPPWSKVRIQTECCSLGRHVKAFPVHLNFTALASDTLNTLVRVFAPF